MQKDFGWETCKFSLYNCIDKHFDGNFSFHVSGYWYYINLPHSSPTKADFIRAKHQMLAFVFRPGKDDTLLLEDDLSRQLHSSVRTSNLETSLRLLSQGADPNYFHEVCTCIHTISSSLKWKCVVELSQAVPVSLIELEHGAAFGAKIKNMWKDHTILSVF